MARLAHFIVPGIPYHVTQRGTGLQQRFDWTGVAVGAATSGIAGGVGSLLAGAGLGSFGDNVLGTLPEVIGSTVGNLVA